MSSFTRAIAGFSLIVADSVRAARAYEAADTMAERRAVMNRFAAEAGRFPLHSDDRAAA
jgi:hypothetical protein